MTQGRWRLLAGALTLAAVVCLLMWGAASAPAPPPQSQSQSEPEPAALPATTSENGASVVALPSTAVEPLARPVTLGIPSIGVSTRLTSLGLRQDGTVEVPDDADLAGWFRRGPPPGSPGSAVILGHVDSMSGPAVFYRLRELEPGDRIAVRLDNGTTVRFLVRSVETYANEDFPAQKVYGQQGSSELNLVTCGGDYDSSRGGYQANVVVNARKV